MCVVVESGIATLRMRTAIILPGRMQKVKLPQSRVLPAKPKLNQLIKEFHACYGIVRLSDWMILNK
jgi:hypothetical protein